MKAHVARSARCSECGQKIRIPKGWSKAAAIRRHVWSKHKEK